MTRKRVKNMTRDQQKAVFANMNTTPKTTKKQQYKINPTKKHNTKNLNISNTPLPIAETYATNSFRNSGKNLDDEIPDFDRNYGLTQDYIQNYSKDIPRDRMPVIEPSDIQEFDHKLEGGYIDIFKPYAMSHPYFPKTFKSDKARKGWVLLGQKDGNPTDDVIEAQILRVPAKDLKPLQSQIWLDKICNNIKKHGKPRVGSPVVNTTIITSEEGYILDGHHRWGQVMVSNPNLKMKVLRVPLDIDTLLKVGKSYGEAVGNKPKK